MINRMRHDRSLTSVPPLVELLAIRLPPRRGVRMRRVREGSKATASAIGCYAVTCRSRYPKAGKSLVIPRGEGYWETLREISISLGQTA
jgi:hypothetical protein